MCEQEIDMQYLKGAGPVNKQWYRVFDTRNNRTNMSCRCTLKPCVYIFVFVNIWQGKTHVFIKHISDTEAIQCALHKTNKAENEKESVIHLQR